MDTLLIRPTGPSYRVEIDLAARLICEGKLVALPTETVYGLGANGLDEAAVAGIYAAKGRPENKPLSLLVAGLRQASRFVGDIPPAAIHLTHAFWPGPLTIILKKSSHIPDIVTAGGETVGLRCPDHPLTRAVLERAWVPIAAPSANPSGAPSPKTAEDVERALGGKIDAILDGGTCRVGTESTIVDLTVSPPKILRQGGLEREAIAGVIGEVN